MKVLVLVVMMVVTVVMTIATTTNDKGIFGCTFDKPKPVNIRIVVDWKLALHVCDNTKSTYTACVDRLDDCIDNLKKMNGEMTEAEWTKVKEHVQDCSDSHNANINVQAFRSLAEIKKICVSMDRLINDLGFTTRNFFPLYKCMAKNSDPGEYKDFKNCINGQ